ncbi:hypothetical protein BH23VER1_BH23VER1_23630 [soil metagenome]
MKVTLGAALVVGMASLAGAAPTADTFIDLLSREAKTRAGAVSAIGSGWTNASVAPLLEVYRFSGDRAILALLETKTGQKWGADVDAWYRWVWSNQFGVPPSYAGFKARLYSRIDPRFAEYFDGNPAATIRLDEIRWGGVLRDGIPPLKRPKMIAAEEAGYLADADVVFGLTVNGDSRAYPKRILAWHEMFKDKVGGESVNGVYCTLCGSMILYRTESDGHHHELGTSGFLYRSNKLMYDLRTKSLWSTLSGEPVVGPLVGKGIKLEPLPVVTTTWGNWRAQHPDTTVLSPDTGHERDYREGVAYRSYFGTDELMFEVPRRDSRLKNKAEVLALRFGDARSAKPIAISTEFLANRPVYSSEHGGVSFVVLTDRAGANRVYESGDREFVSLDGASVIDAEGGKWSVTEAALFRQGASEGAKDETALKRLPAHRAFWFGWFSAHPDTGLVK